MGCCVIKKGSYTGGALPVQVIFSDSGSMKSPILLCVPGLLMAQAPDPAQALPKIRQNVEAFESRLPDFVCREKITSRTVAEKDGSVQAQTVVESAFSGRQKRAPGIGTSFSEERHIESVNGVASHEKALPKGMFRGGGVYCSSVFLMFGPKGVQIFLFAGARADGAPPGTFAISFAATNNRQRIKSKEGTHSFEETGRAWFDSATYEIVRLERRIGPDSGLTIAIDYAAVPIGEDKFRLPSRVSATAHRPGAGGELLRGEYTAEYTDYRKYGSSSTIQYSDK